MNGPFVYPLSHVRRHGPAGYAEHARFRPWLRDEFAFRCVYCLTRESWGSVTGVFDLDHHQPAAHRPDLTLEYDNLLLACARCNARKGDEWVPDPLNSLVAGAVSVTPEGELVGSTRHARRLIRVLDLNGRRLVRFRQLVTGCIRLARLHDPTLAKLFMGYPPDLPDLSGLKPPGGNTRPDGIAQSYFARKQRGELPETY